MPCYVKLLRQDFKDYDILGHVYREGLNILPTPLNPSDWLSGFPFSEEQNAMRAISHCDNFYWIGIVQLCADSRVVPSQIEEFKTDKFVLGPIIRIADYVRQCDTMNAISRYPHLLKFVEQQSQTPALCMAAVQRDGLAIKWVKEQTPALCLTAIQQNGRAIEGVKEQTPELCMMAVRQCGFALGGVKQRTLELCWEAVRTCGMAFFFVPNELQTPELCKMAIQQVPDMIRHVKYKTPDLCMMAVQKDPRVRQYINI